MRGRRGSAALFAVGILAGVAACGNGNAAVFHPAGALSPGAGPGAVTGARGPAPGQLPVPQ